MDRLILRDLAIFEAVARHRSFTAAAAELGISQSSLSYALKQLEKRIGIALLARTTRNVSPTQAGRELLDSLVPAFEGIEVSLGRLQEMRISVSGSVRLTMTPIAFNTIIRPVLTTFRNKFPNVSVECSLDEGLSNIVAEGFDGGVRFNTLIANDMVSVPLTSSTGASIVGSPEYLARHGAPTHPKELIKHCCIGYRHVSSGRLYRWQLAKGKAKFEYEAGGSLAFNDGEAVRAAALDGLGLCYLFQSQVHDDVEVGRLVPVLRDWTPDLPGFSLYYPNKSRTAPAFRALIEHLRGR